MIKAKTILISMILCCMMISYSCKKSSDNQDNNPQNAYRVTQQRDYTDNQIEMTTDYTYSGNRLSQILAYYEASAGTAYGKLEVEYNAGNISKISVSINNNGIWRIREEFTVAGYTGSLPAERIIRIFDENGTLDYQNRLTDTYLNGQVSEEKSYSMQNGAWELYSRAAYTYNAQGQLQKIESYYGSGNPQSTTSYTWQNNLIVGMISIDADSSMLHKIVYDYTGNYLIKASRYFYVNDSLTPTGNSTFNYDASGNLSGRVENSVPASYTTKTEFEYGAAQGNIRQVYTVLGAVEMWNGSPDPWPSKSSGLTGLKPGSVFRMNP